MALSAFSVPYTDRAGFDTPRRTRGLAILSLLTGHE